MNDVDAILSTIAGIDLRWVIWMFAGIGGVWLYLDIARYRLRHWRVHRDRRSQRAWLGALALLFVASFACAGIFVALFGDPARSTRSFLVFASFGAFIGAGIIIRGERADDMP